MPEEEFVGENEFLTDYITRWQADMTKVLAEYGIQDQVIVDNLVEVAYHHVEKELLVYYKIKRIFEGNYDV